MNILKQSLAVVTAALLLGACTKSADVKKCTDPNAINYNKAGTCYFNKDLAIGGYAVTVVKNDLVLTDEGHQFQLNIRDASVPDSPVVEFLFLNSSATPSDFTYRLDGLNFTFATDYVLWGIGYLHGTGSFANDSFNFSGTLHDPYNNASGAFVLKGKRQ